MLLVACTTSTTPATDSPPDPLEGRIVIVEDGDIATIDPDGSNRAEITDDGSDSQYFQPVWSPDARRMAWGGADSDGFYVGFADDDGGSRARVDVAGFPFYLNWSPDGNQIGILRAGSGSDFDFELIDVPASRASVVDSGAPYYFSWSPQSDAVVVHVGGDRLEIFDEQANPTVIGPTSANYLSPRWTDAGIFYLGPDGVRLRDEVGETALIHAVSGFASVNPNQAGTLVAVHTIAESESLTVSLGVQDLGRDSVVVVDVETGEVDAVTDRLSVGSFWSPNGASLMVLAVDRDQLVDVLIWEDGETREVASIEIPISLLSQALAFFDQYAQSWRIWSPGSRAVVLPGSIDGDSGVWVISAEGDEPIRLSAGEWAAWSHD